jgi:hypothetical protein
MSIRIPSILVEMHDLHSDGGEKRNMNLLQYLAYVSRTNSVKFTISQKIPKHPSKTSSSCREQRTNPEYSKSLPGKDKSL